ncbi:hypothetical protein ACJX0J_016300, partial [Zea mays]
SWGQVPVKTNMLSNISELDDDWLDGIEATSDDDLPSKATFKGNRMVNKKKKVYLLSKDKLSEGDMKISNLEKEKELDEEKREIVETERNRSMFAKVGAFLNEQNFIRDDLEGVITCPPKILGGKFYYE